MAKDDIPIADIPTITVADLARKDSVGINEMRRAASATGFFYVDFRDSNIAILKDALSVYTLAERYFSQPEHVKQKDTRTDIRPSQDLGFKKSECDETLEVRAFVPIPLTVVDAYSRTSPIRSCHTTKCARPTCHHSHPKRSRAQTSQPYSSFPTRATKSV